MLFLPSLALLFTVTEALSVCNSTGISLDATSVIQNISSPGYPSKYPLNRECLWNITASVGEVIKLEFKSFDVVAFTCNLGDYVEVRDGQVWQSAVVINQYCNGNKPPTAIYSRSANLLVRFKSDDIIDGVGFQAEYKAVVPGLSCSGSSDRGKNILISKSSGEITSPGYPSNYKNNLDCVWKITTPSPNTVIKLEFNPVELAEPSGPSCENVDYLQVVDGFSHSLDGRNLIVIGKFCGKVNPAFIYSSGRSITLHFKTNAATNAKGFLVTYSSVPLGKCGGSNRFLSLTGDGGTFFSAGYPLEYPKNTDCTWDILVSSGTRVLLTFYKFDLQNDCSSDYVEVLDGRNPDSPQLGQKLCGSAVPIRLISTYNYMRVNFHSDRLLQAKGFLARFESTNTTKVSVEGICSPYSTNNQSFMLSNSSGTITSPNYPSPYPNNINCMWKITVNDGPRVKLTFKNLILQSSPDCTKDYVQLRNGLTASGDIIGTYCSSVPQPRISNGKSMWVKFHSDESVKDLGFEARYESTTEAPSSGSSLLAGLTMNVVFVALVGVLSHD